MIRSLPNHILIFDESASCARSKYTLSPGRVAQGFAVILAAIGTPAKPSQPRGKSAGWPTGRSRTRPPRYPVVKKRAPKPNRSEQSPNPPPQKSA